MWLYLVCLMVGTLHADVGALLRKIEMEPQPEQVEGIDCIYMINLDERPEKWEASRAELAPYGIVPYRFSAVNGWKLTMEEVNSVGVKWERWMQKGVMGTYFPLEGAGASVHEPVRVRGRNYFCHCMSRGSIGIVLSHLSILKHAYESGFETIWVMEDDVQVMESPHAMVPLVEELDFAVGTEGWDILFTDPDTKSNAGYYVSCTTCAWRPNFAPQNPRRFTLRRAVSANLTQVGARYGAYSMIVRRSGMQKLLEFFDRYQIFLPYDMEYTLPDGIRLFSVNRDVMASYKGAISDNGAPNYLKEGEL